jgi:hypothetical protein
MEIEVKEVKLLDDGVHQGGITRVEYRTEPFNYTDVFISVDSDGFELKYGCPTSQGTDSKLMKMLGKFVDIKPGLKVDPEKILVGKKVQFMTQQEKTDKGTFVRIVDNSIKPC